MTATELKQVEAMKKILNEKGEPARNAAEAQVKKLEKTLATLRKQVQENIEDFFNVPESHKAQVAQEIKSSTSQIEKMESQLQVIVEALK